MPSENEGLSITVREFTKIVHISRRDCEQFVFIFGHSANIIDAWCPKCNEALDEKFEKFIREIGYSKTGEKEIDWNVLDKFYAEEYEADYDHLFKEGKRKNNVMGRDAKEMR